jgi:hypothetical protein
LKADPHAHRALRRAPPVRMRISEMEEIALFKYDDFRLWQTDGAGKAIAVVPVAPRGSGNGTNVVAFAEPGSVLDALGPSVTLSHRL